MGPLRILIINPNSTESMTSALKPLIEDLGYTDVKTTYFTAPASAPASINNNDVDAQRSADITVPTLRPLLAHYDGFVVAGYAEQPIVRMLRRHTSKPVVGIFEASVSASLLLLREEERFGIVSTGEVWERLLSK